MSLKGELGHMMQPIYKNQRAGGGRPTFLTNTFNQAAQDNNTLTSDVFQFFHQGVSNVHWFTLCPSQITVYMHVVFTPHRLRCQT